MNVDRWFKLQLQYDVKATCFAKNAPPCPRPGSLDGDVCGGQGTCINATLDNGAYDADATTGVCTCNAGYGDVGCNEKLAPLSSGTPATGTTGIGDWSYYEFDVVLPQQYDASTKVAMLAELRRESGDPVLFVKKIPRTGAVPSVSDYAHSPTRKVSGPGLTTIRYSSRTRNPANTTSPCSTTTCTSSRRPSTTSR